MKVALTGPDGFVGQHLAAELQRRGADSVLAGRRPGAAVKFELDGTLDGAWDALGRPDVLIHLAWAGLPHYGAAHHIDQVPAHYQFLRNMVEAGVKHVVVTGTCYEYGLQAGELAESAEARPCTAYGVGKDVLRRMLQAFEATRPERPFLTWARLFYPWGEGQSVSALYSQLRAAALRGDEEFPMSGGEQLRDYLPVSEMARLLAELALAERPVGLVNVCSGHPVSVRKLVEQWIAGNGWTIRPAPGRFGYPPHEPMAFWGSDQKLRSLVAQ
jgi:nucleoside-diphosphate-sugar epimerase